MTTDIPIITIDGLSSSGKSSISVLLAKKLGWNLLDSGLLYRAIAYLTELESKSINDQDQINKLMGDFKLQTTKQSNLYRIIYKNNDITDYLNTEIVGKNASVVSKLPFIRNLFLPIQHSCIQAPGLIANGRDMGTKVFTNATLKVFFIAEVNIRAKRRHEQLIKQGENVDFNSILASLKARDDADQNRSISPLEPAHDAEIVDSSDLNIESVLDKIYELYTISRVK
tara:strand:+ start:168 stop:848 length:681 start_codon:yes stop_codon:yes gene_type:complete